MTSNTGILPLLSIVVLAATPLWAQRRSDIITAQEIADRGGKGSTAFDVVQALRPRWLKVRTTYMTGDPSFPLGSEGPHVYLNDHDQGEVDYLKTIPAELIAELRWLSASEAGIRYGPTNGPGIVVTLKIPES
jgi:hypothetical protein